MRLTWLVVALAVVSASGHAGSSPKQLELAKVTRITNPGAYDFENPATGDIRSVSRCVLPSGSAVDVVRSFGAATDTVTIAGSPGRSWTIGNVGLWDRITIDCDTDRDVFYYGHPVNGTVTAYRSDGSVEWMRSLIDLGFHPFDDPLTLSPDTDCKGRHGLAALQFRNGYLLVEWMEFDVGYRQVAIGRDGQYVTTVIGPHAMMLRTAANATWWEMFIGESHDSTFQYSAFVPTHLAELRVVDGAAGTGTRIDQALAGLGVVTTRPRVEPVGKLDATSLRKHTIALLTPTPTASRPALDLCPSTDPELARIWLGPEFNERDATTAKRLLMVLWRETQERVNATRTEPPRASPINVWFEETIAPQPAMRDVWARFEPSSDAWVREYQTALLPLVNPIFDRLERDFGGEIQAQPPSDASPVIKVMRADTNSQGPNK